MTKQFTRKSKVTAYKQKANAKTIPPIKFVANMNKVWPGDLALKKKTKAYKMLMILPQRSHVVTSLQIAKPKS